MLQKAKKGYTLVELLVAISLTGIVVTFALHLYLAVNRQTIRFDKSNAIRMEEQNLVTVLTHIIRNSACLTFLDEREIHLARFNLPMQKIEFQDSLLFINEHAASPIFKNFTFSAIGPKWNLDLDFERNSLQALSAKDQELLDSLDRDYDGTLSFDELDENMDGTLEGQECQLVSQVLVEYEYQGPGEELLHRNISVYLRNHSLPQ